MTVTPGQSIRGMRGMIPEIPRTESEEILIPESNIKKIYGGCIGKP